MGKNGGICDGFYLTILDLVCMIKVHKDLVILTNLIEVHHGVYPFLHMNPYQFKT
jgi:hypothetical protein